MKDLAVLVGTTAIATLASTLSSEAQMKRADSYFKISIPKVYMFSAMPEHDLLDVGVSAAFGLQVDTYSGTEAEFFLNLGIGEYQKLSQFGVRINEPIGKSELSQAIIFTPFNTNNVAYKTGFGAEFGYTYNFVQVVSKSNKRYTSSRHHTKGGRSFFKKFKGNFYVQATQSFNVGVGGKALEQEDLGEKTTTFGTTSIGFGLKF